MSGVYLYCIAPAGHAPGEAITGIAAAPVEGLDASGFTLWISPMDKSPAVDLDAVRAHNSVVEKSITQEITTLPVRFGQWLESRQALREKIADAVAAHATALAVVQGALEFGVRVVSSSPRQPGPTPVAAAGSGREYMERLAAQMAAREAARGHGEEIAAALRDAAGARVLRERVEPLEPAAGIVSIAHLVRRPDFEAYSLAVRSITQQYADARFLFSGPWPPYSFAA
jgi:hypothetical protein